MTRFSTSPFAVTNDYAIGTGPAIWAMTISPDGRYLFATDNRPGLGHFLVIDLQAAGGPAETTGSPFFGNANAVRAFP